MFFGRHNVLLLIKYLILYKVKRKCIFFRSLVQSKKLYCQIIYYLKNFNLLLFNSVEKCAVVHFTTWLKKLSGKTLQNLSYVLYEYENETSKIQLKFFLSFYFLATIVKKLYILVITVFSLNCNFCLYFVFVWRDTIRNFHQNWRTTDKVGIHRTTRF